jgi:hypothetical protein
MAGRVDVVDAVPLGSEHEQAAPIWSGEGAGVPGSVELDAFEHTATVAEANVLTLGTVVTTGVGASPVECVPHRSFGIERCCPARSRSVARPPAR